MSTTDVQCSEAGEAVDRFRAVETVDGCCIEGDIRRIVNQRKDVVGAAANIVQYTVVSTVVRRRDTSRVSSRQLWKPVALHR